MKYVQMQASELRPSNSYIERLIEPVSDLLDYSKNLEVDCENNVARIVAPPIVIMQICLGLWKKFVYCGMSFDKIIISPVGYDSTQVIMHLSSQKEKSKNKVIIKIK